jgi:hypothetical protein
VVAISCVFQWFVRREERVWRMEKEDEKVAM